MSEAPGDTIQVAFNPFVGLRPFDEHEGYLFFGRDGQSDELVKRLGKTRFLAVVGVSGSGKSSLVRAGLFPALRGGFMSAAGANWRIALLRPGNAPITILAQRLHNVLRDPEGRDDEGLSADLIEVTLRRGSLGLIDAVRQAGLAADQNVLVVVDQFEELFRYKRIRKIATGEDDAAAFVKLLLEAPNQSVAPVYVMLTMRSDFLGDCAQFRGLPETMNNSQYLIPRMNRDERRQAIEGPIGVGGGQISLRLVQRLLNDVGEDPDQLPVLQHALMRTWQHWHQHRQDGSPLDIQDYEAIGTMTRALSMHADEAYQELNTDGGRTIAEKIFKRLTERGPDSREIRRPTPFEELFRVATAEPKEVVEVIDKFRNPTRSFLMPPFESPLKNESIVDISHESLIRKWKRLDTWVDEESESRAMYLRLADAANRYWAGKAGLWRNPDLKLARDWFGRAQPNTEWAARYGGAFDRVEAFLRKSKWKAFVVRSSVIAVMIALVGLSALVAIVNRRAAILSERAKEQAERQLAVFDTLRSFTYDFADKLRKVPGSDDLVIELLSQNVRTLEQISRLSGESQASARERASNLLKLGDQYLLHGNPRLARDAFEKSRPLIQMLIDSDPANLNWQRDLSIYHEKMGNVLMAESNLGGAVQEYRTSMDIVQQLVEQDHRDASWQRGLSVIHEKIGDVLMTQGDVAGALNEYRIDLQMAEQLARQYPGNADMQRDVAISHERIAAALGRLGQKREADLHQRLAQQIREHLTKN
ncbi:MAG: ATP-binding protein [Betaproteobacteria bacterium]|nr:MAG: ATP-binding protein [Betaproteobacteria bacterium]